MKKKGRKAPFTVVETIYGGGNFAVELIKQVCAESTKRGHRIGQHINPDLARAVLGGASQLATARKLERFSRSNYLFDLSARAAVCAQVSKDRAEGKISICKNFTTADIVNARMLGLEWRGEIKGTERFSRTVWIDHGQKLEVVPDLVIFLDVPVPVAKRQIESLIDPRGPDSLLRQVDSTTAGQIVDFFSEIDLSLQRRLFIEEVSLLPNHLILDADLSAESNCKPVLNGIEALLV